MRELIRNKIYAVLMVLASLPVVILERDGTSLSLFFGVPMFFRKKKTGSWEDLPFMKVKKAGKRVFGAVMSRCREKAMDMEIQRQLAEYDRKAYPRDRRWFCGSCVNSSASAIRGLKNL